MIDYEFKIAKEKRLLKSFNNKRAFYHVSTFLHNNPNRIISYKEIADNVGFAVSTVKNQISNLNFSNGHIKMVKTPKMTGYVQPESFNYIDTLNSYVRELRVSTIKECIAEQRNIALTLMAKKRVRNIIPQRR